MTGKLIRLVGSGLGLGYLPVAPGTWGSVGGVLLWWLTLPLGTGIQTLLLLLAAVPAAWICGVCERGAGSTDPSFIVLDEMLGMYLALLFAQPSWLWAATAFALFRILDIVKPWPVSLAERHLSGGPAILLDDLAAGAAAGVILLVIQMLVRTI